MTISGKEYVTGMFRGDNGDNMATHLYRGAFDEPGFPMCSRGWQRRWYDESGSLIDYGYSIFRNNPSKKGICKVCQRRAELGLDPVAGPKSFKSK